MTDPTKTPPVKSGSDVPLGWLALVIGALLVSMWLVMDFAAMFGLSNSKPPAFLYPTSIGLIVCGYIACFALPRIHERVTELERRLDRLTTEISEKGNPNDQP